MVELDFENQFAKDKQEIPDQFTAKVTDVHDGDTCTVVGDFRKMPVKIRLADINAPEIGKVRGEPGGEESKKWLTGKLLGKTVEVSADPKGKFGKYGRFVGNILVDGLNVNQESLLLGFSFPFGQKGPLAGVDFDKFLEDIDDTQIGETI